MSWEKYDKGIMINIKKNGTATYKIRCWNPTQQRMIYETFSAPEGLNKIETKKWLEERRSEIEKSIIHNPGYISPKITFSSYFENIYLKKELNIKPKTRHEYLKLYQNHIKGALGRMELVNITNITLSSVQANLREKNVGNSTRLAIHRLIRLVLQYAYEDRLILSNPAMCRGIAPKVEQKEQSVLTAEELQRLLDAVENDDLIWKALIYTAVFTGCRRGEIAGLVWTNVDLDSDQPRIHVDRNVVVVHGCDEKVGTPKTQSSVRDIFVYEPLLSILKEYRATVNGDSGYVFRSFSDPDDPINPDTITAHIKKAGLKAGLNCTPHTLRRTLPSILDRGNVRLKVSQKILGHSSEAVTSRYYVISNNTDRAEGMKIYYDIVNGEKSKK